VDVRHLAADAATYVAGSPGRGVRRLRWVSPALRLSTPAGVPDTAAGILFHVEGRSL
jgi:hypothetical protein